MNWCLAIRRESLDRPSPAEPRQHETGLRRDGTWARRRRPSDAVDSGPPGVTLSSRCPVLCNSPCAWPRPPSDLPSWRSIHCHWTWARRRSASRPIVDDMAGRPARVLYSRLWAATGDMGRLRGIVPLPAVRFGHPSTIELARRRHAQPPPGGFFARQGRFPGNRSGITCAVHSCCRRPTDCGRSGEVHFGTILPVDPSTHGTVIRGCVRKKSYFELPTLPFWQRTRRVTSE